MKKIICITSLIAPLLLIGCSESTSTKDGAVDVSWEIGGTTCGAANVSIVEVTIYDKERILTSQTVACQLNRLELDRIPAGTYSVRLDGITANSAIPIFEALIDDVVILKGETTVLPKVYLSEKPGGIDLKWKFVDGSLCTFSGVDTVQVNVWDSHSNRVYQNSLPCDPTKAVLQLEMTTPEHALYDKAEGVVVDKLYAGEYTVQAFGLLEGTDAHAMYFGEEKSVQTIHGRLTPVELVLSPCDGNAICH